MTHSSPDSLSSCPLVLWPAKVVVYRIIHTFHHITSSNLIKTGKHPEGWHEITKLRMQDSLLIETVFGKTPFKWWWEPYHEGGRHCNCVSCLLQHHLVSPHHHLVGNLCLSQIKVFDHHLVGKILVSSKSKFLVTSAFSLSNWGCSPIGAHNWQNNQINYYSNPKLIQGRFQTVSGESP